MEAGPLGAYKKEKGLLNYHGVEPAAGLFFSLETNCYICIELHVSCIWIEYPISISFILLYSLLIKKNNN